MKFNYSCIRIRLNFFFFSFVLISHMGLATNYYVHPVIGDDDNMGNNQLYPLKTLEKASSLQLFPGDAILLAAGHTFNGMLKLEGIRGVTENQVIIGSYQWANAHNSAKAMIDASKANHGIYLLDCSYIIVEDIIIKADNADGRSSENMRCGVLVATSKVGMYGGISLKNLEIQDIFIETKGFNRGDDEVRTANGSQRYGWGIRFINNTKDAVLKDVSVINCIVKNVAHTGIKFTSRDQNIYDVKVYNNRITDTGGPGMQISGGRFGHFYKNYVSHSGSNDDSRKWGRGSGLWTWGSADILIEKNHFLNANGPGDSAGCHIDYNCNDVVVQYNFSANNAGGFCEILGNNYNCAYRYNISVNDGHRVKGENNAFQEGKIFWLSGYAGNNKERLGPFNSYFYNNTVFVSKDIEAKMAVSKVADGVLIANNIFYIEGDSKAVTGDQYKPENSGASQIKNIFFKNNLYLKTNNWPEEVWIQDENQIIGDPLFKMKGGTNIEDYYPQNFKLIGNKGINIPFLENDAIGIKIGLDVAFDILGNPIKGHPDLGAIELKE